MKLLFACIAVVLLIAGVAIHLSEPDVQTAVPVIYWVIDPAPARGEQIALFHRWQIKKGHCTTHTIKTMSDLRAFRRRKWSPAMRKAVTEANAEGAAVFDPATAEADLPITVRVPLTEMRLDAASNDLDKKLVQGVSGVAGDVIEAYSGGMQMRYFQSAGMLADVTEDAKRLGFGPDKTYPALAPALFVDGRQYAFPRNPAQTMYWVNKDAFIRCGQPLPPSRWTIEEFERRGRAYVKAANKPGERQRFFFANSAFTTTLHRSMGLSVFNETLTRCTLDDPRYAKLLALIYKWTYEDHIVPSPADLASFDVEGGWGGADFQLFKTGEFAMLRSGRWALMLLRKFGTMNLAVVEPPHGGRPNTVLSGGQTTVYRGSRHRDLAVLFMAYMADEDYNMQIVRDGDGLPPNPKYAETELFRRPPDHPNEWGCHEAYLNAAKNIAIVQSFSPFVLPVTVLRAQGWARGEVMNRRATPEAAAAECAERINEEIERALTENPRLRPTYDEWAELQKRIDRYRKANRPVPAEWIKNPFHRTIYREKRWLADPETGT